MQKLFLVCTSDFYYKNKIFDIESPDNRDNYYYPYYLLKEKFYESGVLLNTYDYLDKGKEKGYRLLFFDIPDNIENYIDNHHSHGNYLVIWESTVVHPINWKIELNKYFKIIFTWDDSFIDHDRYIKFYWPNKIPENLDFNLQKKNKFCAMIAGHKFKSHPLELYTERVKAIRWFERHHTEDFDLYGMGWDNYCFKGVLSLLNRFSLLTKNIRPNFPSYKGTIEKKKDVYERYKFSICYENARDIPGYITEKIFDCFFAGCVPIYWGAPNVTDFIPEDAFIDKRKYDTYEELYKYLKNMPDEEYLGYIDAIRNFIKSDKIYPFSAECFADTIIREILKND